MKKWSRQQKGAVRSKAYSQQDLNIIQMLRPVSEGLASKKQEAGRAEKEPVRTLENKKYHKGNKKIKLMS